MSQEISCFLFIFYRIRIMFKESTFKIVPNKFINEELTDYIWTNKIKSQISKNQAQKLPLKDLTNRLPSMQNSEKPQNLQIIGYQPQLDIQTVNITTPTTQHRQIVKKECLCQNFLENVHCLKQNIVIQPDDHKNQFKDGQISQKQRKRQQPRRKIFNLDLSDSSQEQYKNQPVKIQLNDQHNQFVKQNASLNDNNGLQTLSESIKDKKKKIIQLQIQMSEQSQAQIANSIKQKLDQKETKPEQIQEVKRVDKRFILNRFDSDSQCESDAMKCQNKQQEDQQLIEIVRSLNINKLREYYSYLKADQQFQAFYPVPPQSKISLIVKRNLDKSQYIVYDGQLISQILKVTKKIGGTFKFLIPNSSKSELRQIATMKSNFLGTEFHCYAKKQSNKDEKYQSISITYQMNLFGLSGPRKVKIYSVINTIPTSSNILQLYTKNHWKNQIEINTYESKTPKWDSELSAFVLNLRGTATQSSIKNCVIVDQATKKKEHIIFGKKSKDIFNLQVKHPMSILQGVAFAVSAFQRKLACE